MHKGRKVAVVAAVLALALAGVAGATQTGILSVRVGGGGSPEASGITVHGTWSLIVRDKRGKVVARRRFENALTSDGKTILADILTDRCGDCAAPGPWRVQVNSTGTPPCLGPLGLTQCGIAGSLRHGGALTVTDTQSTGTIGLSGTIRPNLDATFTSVETVPYFCSSEDDCGLDDDGYFFPGAFTSKTIQPLHVTAGQSVAVSVKISFS